jgi:putative ABC transport system ATP-binding protein
MSLLQAKSVSRRYLLGGKSLDVVQSVSFSLKKGESLALTGPSGSGKSTLLGLLAGLDAPSGGEIWLDGRNLGQMNEESLAAFRGRRLGFLFQSYRLLPSLSALENVMAPLELAGDAQAEDKALAWLKRVGLEQRAGNLPSQLSGGEQQRIALARAMAPSPAILLADEPTGNLDSATGKAMADLIFSTARREGIALVLVTHDATLAKRASRVLAMKDGRLVSDKRRRRG